MKHLRFNIQLTNTHRSVALFIIGMLYAIPSFSQNPEWAILDTKAQSPFHEGMAVFSEKDEGSGKWLYGAINSTNEVAIPAKFQHLSSFCNGTAIAVMGDKYGVINRNGKFVLDPIYSNIKEDSDHPDIYTVELEDKKGVFYNGRMVLPLGDYSYISTNLFPFIEYHNNKTSYFLNSLEGKHYKYCSKSSNMIICRNDYNEYGSYDYFSLSGQPIEKEKFSQSSKSVYAYYDTATKQYGIKNQKTGETLISSKYTILWNGNFWTNDALVVGNDSGNYLIDNEGREHILIGTPVQHEEYIICWNFSNNQKCLYDYKGDARIPITDEQIVVIKGSTKWFWIGNKTFDASRKQYYEGKPVGGWCRENMIQIEKTDGSFYFANMETGKKINGTYELCPHGFHEGVAIVRPKGADSYNNLVIDKNGKVLLRGSEEFQLGDYFSEGTLPVQKKEGRFSHVNGYIYNPLGHGEYVYSKGKDGMIYEWRMKAQEAVQKEDYTTAKEYCYRIMMNNPEDVVAINNYGACLASLGHLDEAIETFQMALDIKPWDSTTSENLEKAKQQKEEQEKFNKQEVHETQTNTFWNALSSFANILNSVSGAINAYQGYTMPVLDSWSDMAVSSTGSVNGNWQAQYQIWEQRAKSNYDSLTNLGFSVKDKSGNRSGSTLQSMSGSKYVQMKKSLRDAQREMRNIRMKASRDGITISPSKWETATVGY